jgi:predicted RNA-binding protein with PIN domain
MLKAVLVAISVVVVFDAAVFHGIYRREIARFAVSVVTQDWELTHK